MEAPSWSHVRVRTYVLYPSRQDFISNTSTFKEWVSILPEAGAFFYRSGDISGTVGAGAFVTIPPNAPFFRHSTETPFTYHVFQWSFVDEQGEVLDNGRPSQWEVRDLTRYWANLGELRALGTRRDGYAQRRIANLWEEILLLGWETRHTPSELMDPTMRRAAQLLQERAGTFVSMSEISSEMGLGPVQFTRRFRATYGVTPIEYLTSVRINLAQRLLIHTDLTLEAIADQMGWSSGYYFSTVFTKHTGISPGRYRRAHRI
jgi:AraC-like DNA-binding protein